MFYSRTTNGFYAASISGDSMPKDVVQISAEEHTALLNGQAAGKIIKADANGRPILVDPPSPTFDQILQLYADAIQEHLDGFAQTRGYNGILSAATYATSLNPKFKAEGQYAVEARDMTWAKCYIILDEVKSGKRKTPTIPQLIADLPPLKWPTPDN